MQTIERRREETSSGAPRARVKPDGRGRAPIAALLFALLAGGCVYAPIPNLFDNRVDRELSNLPGRDIAKYRCGFCHSIEGTRYSRNADAPRFIDLKARYDAAALSTLLVGISVQGHGRMPPYQFAPSEIDILADYIRHVE